MRQRLPAGDLPPDEELNAVLDRMTRVSQLASSLAQDRKEEHAKHHFSFLTLYDRCCGVLDAIHHLLANSEPFVHEAMMLTRPLFTDSLALAEYAATDERRRGELAIGWTLAGLTDLEGYYKDAAARGSDASFMLKWIAGMRRDVQGYARRHNITSTKSWQPDKNTKQLAEKHGRGDEYPSLLLAHHFIHGSTTALVFRASRVDDGSYRFGGEGVFVGDWATGAGSFATRSMLHAARAACRVFGPDEPAQLATLLAECGVDG